MNEKCLDGIFWEDIPSNLLGDEVSRRLYDFSTSPSTASPSKAGLT